MVAQTGGEKGFSKKVGGFFRGTKAELKKISWPNKKELTNFTIIVLVSCALMGILIGLLDAGFGTMIKLIVS